MSLRRTTTLLLALGLVLAAAVARAKPPDAHQAMWPFWEGPGRLGIQVQRMTDDLRSYFGAPRGQGVLVVKVEPDSPAAEAGIQTGDVILKSNGDLIVEPHHLGFSVAGAPAEVSIELEIVRGKKTRKIDVVPRGEPNPALDPETWRELREQMRRGIRKGSDELLKRLEEIERRLRQLEQQMEDTQAHERERT